LRLRCITSSRVSVEDDKGDKPIHLNISNNDDVLTPENTRGVAAVSS
jgi:hypothetical protein